jgi:hypothetical protein
LKLICNNHVDNGGVDKVEEIRNLLRSTVL